VAVDGSLEAAGDGVEVVLLVAAAGAALGSVSAAVVSPRRIWS
jgi:hypothetical protein